MVGKRTSGLDLLKIYATLMVLILHISGFVMSQFSEDAFNISTLTIYFIMEAFAYPAIHLFVMIGSWFMLERVSPIKQITKVWTQTWVVTISGLIVFVAVSKQPPSILGGVSCVLPFLGRAYWFVTEYIILVMLSPFINKGIKMLKARELITLTIIYGSATCVLPTFLPMFPWYQDVSEMANFLLLYLVTACVKRIERNQAESDSLCLTEGMNKGVLIQKKRTVWIVLWIMCVAVLTASAIVIHRISQVHEMYFYAYNGTFVMLEALAAFMAFKDIRIDSKGVSKTITWIQGSSLVVYLLHMHPLFKERYTEWGWFKYVNVNSPGIYVLQIGLTVIVLFGLGTIIGKIFIMISNRISSRINDLVEGMFAK